jgi:hypothetical protein
VHRGPKRGMIPLSVHLWRVNISCEAAYFC